MFRFEVNYDEWSIEEVDQEKFWENKEREKDGFYFGLTMHPERKIWLNKDSSEEQKRKTLIHELIHCYRFSFMCSSTLDGQEEDFWCDFIANAFPFINKVVDNYFYYKDTKEWNCVDSREI